MPELTRELIAGVRAAWKGELPVEIIDEARRTMLNVIGTAVGASHSAGVNAIVDVAARPAGGGPAGQIPGRVDTIDLYTGCLGTAAAAHMEDFDDGHEFLRTHPGASALGMALNVGAMVDAPSERVLTALVLACEVQFRLATAIQPEHYAVGWHTTGTVGGIGAAVGAGCLLELDERQLLHAVGLAVAQEAGLRQGFGTMGKPLNAGKASANGVLAALLARAGMTSDEDALGRSGGFLESFSPAPRPAEVTADWGHRWHALMNTYKPYPCGRVIHPIIDAGIDLRAEVGDAALIETADIECHPMVEELTGLRDPVDGLETKFSAIHGLAVALVLGQGSATEFSDAAAVDPAVRAVRSRTTLTLRSADGPNTETVTVRVRRRDGAVFERTVTAARGTIERKLDYPEIGAKVRALIDPELPGRSGAITDHVATMRNEPIVDLIELLTPER